MIWRSVKRAAKRAEQDLAVQGWLIVLSGVAGLLASVAA